MLEAIEQFSRAHQYTIAAFATVSTFAAVLVSLALALIAQRSRRTRIKAHASIRRIVSAALQGTPPRYLTVTITNVGVLPVHIPFAFFSWKLPFKSEYYTVNPWDATQHDPLVRRRDYPAEIKPRSSATFFLAEISVFQETLSNMLLQEHLSQWRSRPIRAVVVTEDAKLFKVKIDRSLKRKLAELGRAAALKIAGA
jgi:hypothetical protein